MENGTTGENTGRNRPWWLALPLGAVLALVVFALAMGRPQPTNGAAAIRPQPVVPAVAQQSSPVAPAGFNWKLPTGSQDTAPLNCLSCHNQTLTYHDKLGKGNNACYTCHVSTDMKSLHLANGTPLDIAQAPQLCAQCHQKRYTAWLEGTHGIPGTVAAVSCTACHNPHQPQVVKTGLAKPQPPPLTDVAGAIPGNALAIVGVSVAVLLGLAIVYARRKEVL